MGLIHLHSDLYQSVFYHVRSGVEFTSYWEHVGYFILGWFHFYATTQQCKQQIPPWLSYWNMKTSLTAILYTSHKIPKSHKHIKISNIVLYPKWFRLRLTSLPAMVAENHLGDSLWYCLCGIISITWNEVGGSTHRGWRQPLSRDPRPSKRLHSGLWVYAPVPLTSLPSRTISEDYKPYKPFIP